MIKYNQYKHYVWNENDTLGKGGFSTVYRANELVK